MATWLRNLLFLCVLFFSVYAQAYTVASTTSATTVGSTTLAITIPASAAGDTIYIVQSTIGMASNTTAPTDNKSTVYTKVDQSLGASNGVVTLWKADNIVSGITSVTITNGSGMAPQSGIVREYNGLSNPSVDVHNIGSQITGTNPTSPNITTGSTNEVIVGYTWAQLVSPPTAGTGFGNLTTVAQSTTPAYTAIEDKAAPTAGSYNASFVSGTSAINMVGVVGALTPGSVAAGSNHFLSSMGVGQ